MDTLIRVLETALPVFLTLGLGMLCRKKKLFDQNGAAALRSLAVNVTLPAVLFSAFATAEYSARSAVIPLVIFALCTLALGLGFLLARLFRIPGKLTPYLATGFEAGMFGYGLFALLFPGQSNAGFAIIDLGQVLFVFTVYKILLSGRAGLKNAVRDALTSPVLWSIFAGLLFGATGLYQALVPSGISGVIDSAASFIAAPTSAVILLTIGYDLVFTKIDWRRTAAAVLLRIAVMGVLLCVAVGLNRLLLGRAMQEAALVLMFILPPPYVLPVFADAEDERAALSSSLSIMTLVSLCFFAVLSVLL